MTTELTAAHPLSHAQVATDRPARYAKQLVSHMGRKITATWEDSTASGRLAFAREGEPPLECTLECVDQHLVMTLREPNTDPGSETAVHVSHERIAQLEHVIGIHLARFGVKDSLEVRWIRADGCPGSSQGPLTAEDVAAHRRSKAKARAETAAAGTSAGSTDSRP